jgi:hypothetical protein
MHTEHKIVFEGTTWVVRGKENVGNGTYWGNPSICAYNIMHCTISSWLLGEHGDREWVSNGDLIWLKHNIYRPEVPPWTSNTYF